MTRSLKKLLITNCFLLNNISSKKYNIFDDLNEKISNKLKKRIEGKVFFLLKSKNIKICSFMVGLNFLVYNGKNYFFIIIRESMINYKIGEFLTTKILGSEIHLDKKKRKTRDK